METIAFQAPSVQSDKTYKSELSEYCRYLVLLDDQVYTCVSSIRTKCCPECPYIKQLNNR